ncbi:MAG: CBS domain-containing protein [Candidatus Altiarchaeota archaeon]
MDFTKILGWMEKKLPEEEPIARDYMRNTVVSVAPQQTVGEAVDLMFQYDVHGVIVTENDRAIGVFSGYDVNRLIAKRKFHYDQKISEVMSSPAVTVDATTEVRKALKIMLANKYKRLPVVEEDKVVGLLAIADLAAALIAKTEE